MAFQVQQIDHVEVFVPDREEAARWLERTLGLTVDPTCRKWAEHPAGPLMMTTADAGTKIALFVGEPQGANSLAGFKRVAFRVDSSVFRLMRERLEELDLQHRGHPLASGDYVDHDGAWSIYFDDPWGNPYEITTYDVDG